MAVMTKSALETAAKTYVDASKQLNTTFTATVDDFTKAIEKIGQITTLYLPQIDKLPELDGNNLPYGQIIEEVMVNDFLPTDYSYVDGDNVKSSPRPTFDEAVYSYPLADKLFEVGIPYSQFQKVSLDAGSYANFVSSSIATLDSSVNAWNYAAKRQLLGNVCAQAYSTWHGSDSNCCSTGYGAPKDWDEDASEKFIRAVLNQIEEASDMNESNLAGHTVAAAPSLTLYVNKKVMPSVKVKALAGAIHKEELAIPAKIKTVLDFGEGNDNVVALLIDDRAVKLHDDINEVESIAANFVVSTKRHLKQTGYISKYGFVHLFRQ